MADGVPASYLMVPGKVPEYFEKISRGTAPSRFTTEHLVKMDLRSKNDRALVPLLKSIRFLDESNAPTGAYREFLNPKKAPIVLGRQLLASYEGVFEVERDAHRMKPSELVGVFKSVANVSDSVAEKMAGTFVKLCSLADVDGARANGANGHVSDSSSDEATDFVPARVANDRPLPSLNYVFQIQLPNTTDLEVHRAIFKALRENLP